MRKTKFVFAVSFVAMFAVNAAVATAPKSDNSDIGTAHGVFTKLGPIDTNGAGAGIAGVTYVNRAVNQAGAAAVAAEAHAAASGAYAVSAKSSADSAGNAAATAKSAADAAAAAASNAANAAAQALTDAKTYARNYADGKVINVAPVDGAHDTTAPSYSLMVSTINDMAVSGITDVADDLEAVARVVSGKQDKLGGTNIRIAGSGNVVTEVSASDGLVTVTKGTTLGSLATKSKIATDDIEDGAVTKVKIENGAVTTTKIYDGAVTVAKTSGLYGVIPRGSQGNTSESANIWVQ